jgi:hypothetical protein
VRPGGSPPRPVSFSRKCLLPMSTQTPMRKIAPCFDPALALPCDSKINPWCLAISAAGAPAGSSGEQGDADGHHLRCGAVLSRVITPDPDIGSLARDLVALRLWGVGARREVLDAVEVDHRLPAKAAG